jgi:hypothetical protein
MHTMRLCMRAVQRKQPLPSAPPPPPRSHERRYRDFQVNEIDADGNVARLTSLKQQPEAAAPKVRHAAHALHGAASMRMRIADPPPPPPHASRWRSARC